MSSVAHSLIRMFRSAPANASATAIKQAPVQPRISRRSSGLNEFTRAIEGEDGLRILDLGPTSPSNISHLTGLGHKVYNEDVLKASTDPTLVLPTGEDGKAVP